MAIARPKPCHLYSRRRDTRPETGHAVFDRTSALHLLPTLRTPGTAPRSAGLNLGGFYGRNLMVVRIKTNLFSRVEYSNRLGKCVKRNAIPTSKLAVDFLNDDAVASIRVVGCDAAPLLQRILLIHFSQITLAKIRRGALAPWNRAYVQGFWALVKSPVERAMRQSVRLPGNRDRGRDR
jgi:hypothetical protein